jgi:hypothetical protein
MTAPSEPDEPDPLAAYAAGDPDAVRAAQPPEPSAAEWELVRRRIHERLDRPASPPRSPWRLRAPALAAAAALAIAAAVGAWVAFDRQAPPVAPELAEAGLPACALPAAPLPHEAYPDPLAEYAILPMASTSDVVLHRVPGDGWLPVGEHPLPGALALAGADDVELDDPEAVWPSVTPAPGFAPMIFAAKPR